MRTADIVLSSFMLLLCVFLAFFMSVPEGSMISQTQSLNPFSFPKLILIVLFVCSAIVLLKALLKKNAGTGEKIFNRQGLKYGLMQVVLAGVFIASLKTFGFIASSLVIMFVANLLPRETRTRKDWLDAAVFSLVLTAVAYVGFRLLLNINLP